MATRGCIIELKKDVCKIGYLHYGAGFASEFIQKYCIDSKYLERIFEMDREWEKREIFVAKISLYNRARIFLRPRAHFFEP